MNMEEPQLDAKAIHSVYAPLWERVPEARPGDIRFKEVSWEQCIGAVFSDGPGAEHDDNFYYTYLLTTAAAALCRVAVEDWLLTQRLDDRKPEGSLSLEDNPGWPSQRFHVSVPTRVESIGGFGPTIHHALVAAALAVAECHP